MFDITEEGLRNILIGKSFQTNPHQNVVKIEDPSFVMVHTLQFKNIPAGSDNQEVLMVDFLRPSL